MCGRCLQCHQKGCFVFVQPQGNGVLSHPRVCSPGPQGPAASSPREGVPREGGLSIIHKKVCSGPSGGPGSSKGQPFVPESTSTKMELRPGVAATRWGPGQPMRQCLSHRENRYSTPGYTPAVVAEALCSSRHSSTGYVHTASFPRLTLCALPTHRAPLLDGHGVSVGSIKSSFPLISLRRTLGGSHSTLHTPHPLGGSTHPEISAFIGGPRTLCDNSEINETIGDVPQPLLVQPAGLHVTLGKNSWAEPAGRTHKSWLSKWEEKANSEIYCFRWI